ncbi:MAG: hypothetical protein AAF265_15350 [Pseudomonadota bacterium]
MNDRIVVWRDGKSAGVPWLKALFESFIHALTFGGAVYIFFWIHGFRVDYPFEAQLGAVVTGVAVYIVCFLAALRPAIEIKSDSFRVNQFGLWYTSIKWSSISRITIRNLGPLGYFLDVRSELGTNNRMFVFVGSISTEQLKRYVDHYNVEVD